MSVTTCSCKPVIGAQPYLLRSILLLITVVDAEGMYLTSWVVIKQLHHESVMLIYRRNGSNIVSKILIENPSAKSIGILIIHTLNKHLLVLFYSIHSSNDSTRMSSGIGNCDH